MPVLFTTHVPGTVVLQEYLVAFAGGGGGAPRLANAASSECFDAPPTHFGARPILSAGGESEPLRLPGWRRRAVGCAGGAGASPAAEAAGQDHFGAASSAPAPAARAASPIQIERPTAASAATSAKQLPPPPPPLPPDGFLLWLGACTTTAAGPSPLMACPRPDMAQEALFSALSPRRDIRDGAAFSRWWFRG